MVTWSIRRVQGQTKHAAAKKVVFASADKAEYKEMAAGQGVSMAVIWGDSDKGAHATFTKFVPGYDAGMHTTPTTYGSSA